jgi:hypothetical protein
LDLGEVWESPNHTVTVPIRNGGPHPVTITEFASTCDCSGFSPHYLTIPAGGTVDLSIRIDLTHRLPYHLGLAKREVKVRIDPVFQGDSAPTPGWELVATVRSRVSFNTSKLSFLDMCTSGGEAAVRRVHATVHMPLERLEVVAVPPIATVRVIPSTDETERHDILVSPDPALPIGPFRFDLRITVIGQDGQAYPCATIPVDGEMQPATRIVPSMILLGEHSVPSSPEADFMVHLRPGNVIERAELDSQYCTVSRLGPNGGTGVRYRVVMHITKPGDHHTSVVFVVRRSDGLTESAKLVICGYGESQVEPGGGR